MRQCPIVHSQRENHSDIRLFSQLLTTFQLNFEGYKDQPLEKQLERCKKTPRVQFEWTWVETGANEVERCVAGQYG